MEYEYTFLLPCLNEEKSIKFCIEEIKRYIVANNLNAEILVADNESTDGSKQIAIDNGARVINVAKKGYGNTLIEGTKNAFGKYCIMGDSDGSYDFFHLDEFIEKIKQGYDLVVGNRFKGGIQKGAMSVSHKIGVRFLTVFANMMFHTCIKDYHCGLRAYDTDKIKSLKLKSEGMEYASEMIIKAKLNDLKIIEVSTILRKDLRNEKSHLRTIRDGFRHLLLILKLSFKNK